jgi:hypothetical protein
MGLSDTVELKGNTFPGQEKKRRRKVSIRCPTNPQKRRKMTGFRSWRLDNWERDVRDGQLLLKRLERVVRRKIYPVEGRVPLWQLVGFASLLDRETSWAFGSWRISEPADRESERSSR